MHGPYRASARRTARTASRKGDAQPAALESVPHPGAPTDFATAYDPRRRRRSGVENGLAGKCTGQRSMSESVLWTRRRAVLVPPAGSLIVFTNGAS